VSTVTAVPRSQQEVASPQTVDYQSFLRLLVAQLKNQDPTSPMESTDYVAQLATFSQVEQSGQINVKREQILAAYALSQPSRHVGREITSADGEVPGIVTEVKLYSDGVVAKLESGEEVIVGPGVVIR